MFYATPALGPLIDVLPGVKRSYIVTTSAAAAGAVLMSAIPVTSEYFPLLLLIVVASMGLGGVLVYLFVARILRTETLS
jgi:hypothetical protein